MYLEYNTVVVLCKFFGSGGKYFLVLRMYLVYNTVVRSCGCVSFLVVVGNCYLNENTFLQKKSYWVTLYDLLADVCFS
jgi:hypothetical protein